MKLLQFAYIILYILSQSVEADNSTINNEDLMMPPIMAYPKNYYYYADRVCEILKQTKSQFSSIPKIWRLFVDSTPLKVGWEAHRRYAWLTEKDKEELARLIVKSVDWEYETIYEYYDVLYHFVDYEYNSIVNMRVLPYIRRYTNNKKILSLLSGDCFYIDKTIFSALWRKCLVESKYYESCVRKSQQNPLNIFGFELFGPYESYLAQIGINAIVLQYYVKKNQDDKRGWDFLWYRHYGDGEYHGLDVIGAVNGYQLTDSPYGKQMVRLAQDPKNRYQVIGPEVAMKSLNKREWSLWDKIQPSLKLLTHQQCQQLALLMIEAADWEYETMQEFWKSPAYYSFKDDDINSYLNLMILPHIRKYTDQKDIYNLTKTKYCTLSQFKNMDIENKGFSSLITLLLQVMFTNCDYEFNLRSMENRYEWNGQGGHDDVIEHDRFADMGVRGKHVSYIHECNILQFIVDYYIKYYPDDKRAWDFLWHFSKVAKSNKLKALIYDNNLQNNDFAKQILHLLKDPKNRENGIILCGQWKNI